MTPEIQKMHQDLLSKLADVALATATDKKEYTETDMLNVTLIFQDVFMNKIFDYHQALSLAGEDAILDGEKAGLELRKLIQRFTGIDMHEVAKTQ